MRKLRFTWTSPRFVGALWIAYWALLAVLTHWPAPEGFRWPIKGGDRIVHVLIFFSLTLLGGRAIHLRGKLNARTVVAWGCVYSIYAVLDEATQPWFRRTASVNDWLADLLGVLLASSILLMYPSAGLPEDQAES